MAVCQFRSARFKRVRSIVGRDVIVLCRSAKQCIVERFIRAATKLIGRAARFGGILVARQFIFDRFVARQSLLDHGIDAALKCFKRGLLRTGSAPVFFTPFWCQRVAFLRGIVCQFVAYL